MNLIAKVTIGVYAELIAMEYARTPKSNAIKAMVQKLVESPNYIALACSNKQV